jgi:excinuclease ABC subunit C
MKSQDVKKSKLPDAPGVYYFKNGRKILYIGKATSLKDRVRSYFARDILTTRSPLIAKMLGEAKKVTYVQTDSVLEALILEAHEIKKYQPPYNSKEKDDKSYNYVTITEETFPKVLITRGSGTYGPFPHGSELREALKIIRKIFPFRDDKCKLSGRPCFNAQIGLCPGVCVGQISHKDYKKNIQHLSLFFEAKKPKLIKSLEREMQKLAKNHKFEEANKSKKQIFALGHIQDIALLKDSKLLTLSSKSKAYRIEAYDIAHISGTDVVGVMTVVEDGELNKGQYRKFKLRTDTNDDVNNLKEVLTRRLTHSEWRLPDLIVVDGGQGQINAAREIIKKVGLDIDIVSAVKDERHKAREILGKNVKNRAFNIDREILLANAEAHRFALKYHRKLRGRGFRI